MSVKSTAEDTASKTSTNVVRLPLLSSAKPTERLELFARKLHACCTRYDFLDEKTEQALIDLKTFYLKEVVEYFDKTPGVLGHEAIYALSVLMLGKNVFRTFPPKDPNYDPDEDDAICEPAWVHLELVYEYFLGFIGSEEFQPSIAKKYLDAKFVTRLLYAFASDDIRERSVLKTVLHRIYGKFLGLRATIRKQINNVFLSFLYDDLDFAGVAEILEILGSIINGYVCPLKKEHLQFLCKILIPLHASKDLPYFQPQLVYCMVQYIEKEPSTTLPIVKGLLKFWPKMCTSKTVLFLGELEELVDVMQPKEFSSMQTMILKQLALCVESDHFQISERALYFWDNEYILSLIEVAAKDLFPLVIPSIEAASRTHWNESIQSLSKTVLQSIQDSNPTVYFSVVGEPPAQPKKRKRSLWERAIKFSLRS